MPTTYHLLDLDDFTAAVERLAARLSTDSVKVPRVTAWGSTVHDWQPRLLVDGSPIATTGDAADSSVGSLAWDAGAGSQHRTRKAAQGFEPAMLARFVESLADCYWDVVDGHSDDLAEILGIEA